MITITEQDFYDMRNQRDEARRVGISKDIRIAALEAENAKMRELLTVALDDNYWHAKGCESDLTADCTCWVGEARAVLAKVTK